MITSEHSEQDHNKLKWQVPRGPLTVNNLALDANFS